MLNLPKNLIIKTYLHHSGLAYLGLSLFQKLKAAGHQVFFIPKVKYVKEQNRFVKKYLPLDFDLDNVLPMNLVEPSSHQILNHIRNNRVQALISMETLMEGASWLKFLKRNSGIKLIDIPMLEWVNPIILKNKGYSIFDEIWALTQITEHTFKNFEYPQTKKIKWDFVDREIFYPEAKSNREFIYFHQASLNPDHSTKNTRQVLEAFQRMSEEGVQNIYLVLSGNLSNLTEKDLKFIKNIEIQDRVLSRHEVASRYRMAHCVVAPSTKEGLGLSLYEAAASGCQIITTNASPMNEVETKYLCQVSEFKKDKSLVPLAELTSNSIYQQMKKVYEEHYVG